MTKGDRFGDYIRQVGREQVKTFFDESRDRWRLIRDERQTYYDDQNQMMEWPTEQEAIDWLEQNFDMGGG